VIHIVRPDLDDNRSMWAETAPPQEPLPPLSGSHLADVVIIGGGFTGLSTAYHLIRRYPNRRVVLLEGRRVGNGASGRNGGMALNWINGVEARDPVRARRVWDATLSGLDGIEAMIREHQLPVRFRRDGCLEAYTEAKRAEAAHQKAEKLASWGIPVRYLSGAELHGRVRAEGVVGAVLDPTAGRLHGVDLVRAMRDLVVRLGVAVYEDSPVVRVEQGAEHVVSTASGSVRAPWLVLGTNAYTHQLGFFRYGHFPLHSHVISTEPLPAERWRELGWGDTAGFSDDLDRIAYASMSEDGRLLFGGGGNRAYDYLCGSATSWRGDASARFAFVRSILDRYFPGARDVRVGHQWTGTLCVTMSRVCSMGVTGRHGNVLYALGYSGHGVVLGNLAGRVLCDLYSDHHEPWRELPFYQRRLGGIPGEPFRWVGYQGFTRLTGRSPRRYEADG
jgi:gamma-glutamylputrescine oxidase